MNKEELSDIIKNDHHRLHKNYEAFLKVRSELLKEHGEGKYVLIINKEIKGVFDIFGDALVEGYNHSETFSIQRLSEENETETVATPFL